MAKVTRSDEQLWEAIQENDNRAFAAFYERYWLLLYKAALHYLKDKSDAEEVVQEVFVNVWNRRKSLDIQNFQAYLTSATRYEVYRRIRIFKVNKGELNKDFSHDMKVVYNAGLERLNLSDNWGILEKCLEELPKRCREIYYMSKMDQLSNTEISDRLSITNHTVENQLAIALKHLKRNFSRFAVIIYCLFFYH
ncbi:MAG: sigma-70 family RNA polymerase sigma factor [Flavobacterium sp.]|nr:MAG: sigma-70 family RNA polymerase sigma factor [Flavobacterium sp.]